MKDSYNTTEYYYHITLSLYISPYHLVPICTPHNITLYTHTHHSLPYTNPRYNINFRGLSLANAVSISNWMHYRPPQSVERKKAIEQERAIYEEKILDALEKDTPKGVWTINATIDETAVVVRNLYWPGAMAFHKIDSPEFGYCYFGDGIKNHNLPFLI